MFNSLWIYEMGFCQELFRGRKLLKICHNDALPMIQNAILADIFVFCLKIKRVY